MTESTIKGKSHSTIKGTRVHDLRSRSIIYRLPSTFLGKPTAVMEAERLMAGSLSAAAVLREGVRKNPKDSLLAQLGAEIAEAV
ncbi:hypothetical protein CN233_25180 [Sinorhizobium meliloti]|uniref:hypothetical protein n=1 Tax=Rhizobium meliloti TaxID=382 RepID=UPI000FD9898F|nr:hypothetical protein [Sinorhizobium meliloti]RVG25671.1 hypothetical protein CN233_25180 [Sinorhizobium meliloti]RVK93186.1 hypothetical protein CN152_23580 [Sinorhizobium meliloti]RVN41671.1 hypothetical protein CN113_24840 [Sinorhizobium meliloti]